MLIRKQVSCPYCGTVLTINDCPVVATNRLPDDVHDFTGSTRTKVDQIGGHPVLWRPPTPLPKRQTMVQRFLDSLNEEQERIVPAALLGPAEDLPARICTHCLHPLPGDIGERPILTVGIVGTTGAGKSHYIASMIRVGAQLDGMRHWGFDEFTLDQNSAQVYSAEYQSVFNRATVLPQTNPNLAGEARFNPLAVRTTFRGGTPVTLLFHDVAGEPLRDRGMRARHAPFLRRAAALIFLIDPLMIEPIRQRIPDTFMPDQWFNQADLVNACLFELGETGRHTPVAITLSKSDLLRQVHPDRDFRFLRPPDPDPGRAWHEMGAIDREVSDLFIADGAPDLAAVRRRYGPDGRVSFHAVAPIGHRPDSAFDDGRTVPAITPLRCLDPLIKILAELPQVTWAAGE